jgi:Rap1a immunity proteins
MRIVVIGRCYITPCVRITAAYLAGKPRRAAMYPLECVEITGGRIVHAVAISRSSAIVKAKVKHSVVRPALTLMIISKVASRRHGLHCYCSNSWKTGNREAPMSRLALAILLAIFTSTAQADPPAVARTNTAGFYLAGCKDFIKGKSNFLGGRCVGAVEVLDALSHDTKAFCAPEATNNLERVRIIVAYIETRPERMKEDFRFLANEAMANAWPCKN